MSYLYTLYFKDIYINVNIKFRSLFISTHSSTLSVPLHCGSLLNSSAEGRLFECFFLAFVYFKEIVKTFGYHHKIDTKLSQFVVLLAQVSHAPILKRKTFLYDDCGFFPERNYRPRDRPRAGILARACAAWQRQLPQRQPWQR